MNVIDIICSNVTFFLLQVTSKENNVTNPLNLDTNRCVETYPSGQQPPALARSSKKEVEKSSVVIHLKNVEVLQRFLGLYRVFYYFCYDFLKAIT